MNVYRKALEVLKVRGWTHGTLLNHGTGAVCLVGAVGVACGMDQYETDWYRNPALRPLAEVADELFPRTGPFNFVDRPEMIYEINDNPDYGREAVEQLLEKTAIRMEEREGL